MQKKIILSLIVLVCIIVLGYLLLGNTTDQIRNYPPRNTTIVAFGDSLVFGYGATAGNDFVSQLGKMRGQDIINHGVSGNTTADGLLRLDTVLEEDPGTVLVLLGGNDFLRRVPLETTRNNLATIISQLSDSGAVVVLLGVRGNILGDASEDMYAELSNTYGALYVPDVLDGLLLKPEFMFDGIHPNDAGYTRIAKRLLEVLQEYDL